MPQICLTLDEDVAANVYEVASITGSKVATLARSLVSDFSRLPLDERFKLLSELKLRAARERLANGPLRAPTAAESKKLSAATKMLTAQVASQLPKNRKRRIRPGKPTA